MVLYPNLLPSPFSMQNHALGHNLFLKRGGQQIWYTKLVPFLLRMNERLLQKVFF